MYDKIDWKLVASCAAGFVAGAVVTLLYAPASGEEVRESAKEKISGGYDVVSTGLKKYTGAPVGNIVGAKFQVERLFAAVTAGVEEAKKTRSCFESK